MACWRRHFEARQRPEAPECWRHLSISGWLEVCRAHQKHVNKCELRIIPELNGIILLKLRHEWYTTISIWAGRNLTRGSWFKMAQKLMLKRNYNPRQSRERRVTSEHFTFLLPAFESDFRCSRNGGPPIIMIIFLYLLYQVYFVIIIIIIIIIMEFFGYCSNYYKFKNFFLKENCPFNWY